MEGISLKPDTPYKYPGYYFVLLLLAAVISFWPLSFHIFSLKNDALNYFLPTRYLVSESFHRFELPLWTPYLNMGYPLHGDLQAGVWNPIVQLLSLFGHYTLYTLQLETLFYIFMSGAGMFFLLKHFQLHPHAALLGSVAYMLCGFNIDSAQFLNWIAGTAFLPFVILNYYRCITEKSLRYTIYTGFSLYLLFNCAYPAGFVITLYLLLFFFIFLTSPKFLSNIISNWKSYLAIHLTIAIVFILFSLPAIISYLQSLPLMERGSGAGLEAAMSNALHPFTLSTLTLPASAWKMPGITITDPLERNSWFGITALIFMIAAFVIKQPHRFARFSKWCIPIFLVFSFGEWGGLRLISYYLLPLMDSFRHPANAKMFTVFFSVILAAFTFHLFIIKAINFQVVKKAWWITLIFTFTVLIISFFFPADFFSMPNFASFISNANQSIMEKASLFTDTATFTDLVWVCCIFQFPFLFLLYRFIKKYQCKNILLISVINSVFFAAILQPFTVIKKDKAVAIQQLIKTQTVNGYPVPNIQKPLKDISADNEKFFNEIGCLSMYQKKTGRSDYRITPSNLLNQNNFWFNYKFRIYQFNFPVIYSVNKIGNQLDWESKQTDSAYRWAFRETKYVTAQATNYSDSVKIQLTEFKPGCIKGKIISSSTAAVVLLQNIYPRWKLYVDNQPQKIIKTNIAFMGFEVPNGEHQFSFQYQSSDLDIAFIVSTICILLLCIYKITEFRKKSV